MRQNEACGAAEPIAFALRAHPPYPHKKPCGPRRAAVAVRPSAQLSKGEETVSPVVCQKNKQILVSFHNDKSNSHPIH